MNNLKKDYVEIIYNQTSKPFSLYPDMLTKFISKKFEFSASQKLLEIGCGRGEFANGFKNLGLDVYCIDQSTIAKRYFPDLNIQQVNLSDQPFPYPDNFFDIIYSKSVVEHFYYPEKIFQEAYRTLKPGGILITLCPDWESNFKIYYEDFTHRTPFMKTSLENIQLICGFSQVKVSKFRQLPITWRAEYFFNFFTEITRLFVPNFFKKYSKWVRFSKEIMLFSSSIKPEK